jgi:hypothetical protein
LDSNAGPKPEIFWWDWRSWIESAGREPNGRGFKN